MSKYQEKGIYWAKSIKLGSPKILFSIFSGFDLANLNIPDVLDKNQAIFLELDSTLSGEIEAVPEIV